MAGVDGEVTDVVLAQGETVPTVGLHPVRRLRGGCVSLRPGLPGAEETKAVLSIWAMP